MQQPRVEILDDDDDCSAPESKQVVDNEDSSPLIEEVPPPEEDKDVVWKQRVGKLPKQQQESDVAKSKKKKKKSTKHRTHMKEDGAPSSGSESDVQVSSSAPIDDNRPLHEVVVPPYSSESENEVEVISFNGDDMNKKKKKKKKKTSSSSRPGRIIGPVYEHFDVGIPAGEYVDITPLDPLPKYGRIERGVMKKVLRPGKGPCPKAGTIVSVEHHQLGFLQSDRRIFMDTTKTFMEPDNARPEHWVFGCDQQIPGLEAGIFTMRAGEKARFKIDWRYAYGERGVSPGPPYIPPKADIYLDVTMFSWKPARKERSAMSSAEIFEEAKRVKEEANYAFKEGKWAEANYILDDVFNCIKLMFHEYLQTEWNAIRKLEAQALNNQCMCYIRMGDYEMGERRARKCLEILQEDIKALYRIGLCCNEQKKYAEAKKFLKYAVCLRPESLTIRDEYNRACRNLRDEKLASKKTWHGVFNRVNKLGDKEELTKLKEVSETNARLDEYERKKREESIQQQQHQPQQQQQESVVSAPSSLEQIASRSGNTRKAQWDGPPRMRRTADELAFEKEVLGKYADLAGEEEDEMSRFEQTMKRRDLMESERERRK